MARREGRDGGAEPAGGDPRDGRRDLVSAPAVDRHRRAVGVADVVVLGRHAHRPAGRGGGPQLAVGVIGEQRQRRDLHSGDPGRRRLILESEDQVVTYRGVTNFS